MAADRRGALIPLLIITWIVFSPSPQSAANRDLGLRRPRIEDAVEEERRSLDVLNNSTFEASRFDSPRFEYVLNLTGFEEDRGYAWHAWPHVRESSSQSEGWWQRAVQGTTIEPRPVPLYDNVTGYVQGRWTRSALQDSVTAPRLNLTEYAPENPFGGAVQQRDFQGNLTGNEGDVQLKLMQGAPVQDTMGIVGNVTEMRMHVTLWDDATEHDQIPLRGLYFTEAAFGVLTTTSPKFAGVFALPHLMPNEHTFNLSKLVMNESISRVIQKQIRHDITSLSPWSTISGDVNPTDAFAAPRCELIVWLQQEEPAFPSSRTYTSGLLSFLEHELRFPTGAFLPPVPEMRFRMTAFSPDCGYVIGSAGPPTHSPALANHLSGPKMPVQSNRGLHALLIYTGVMALQVLLLLRQMREASTPSTRSRISFYTIAGMALGDGFATLSFCTLGSVLDGISLNLMAAGFVGFAGMLFFGMRFLIDIWAVHAPELRSRERVEVQAELRRREEILAGLRETRERRAREAVDEAVATVPVTESNVEAQPAVPTASPQEVNPTPAQDSPQSTPLRRAPQPLGNLLTNTQASPRASGPPALPLPVTAQRPIDTGATPVFYMPSDQGGLLPVQPLAPLTEEQQSRLADILTDARVPSFASLYVRFFILLLALVFLSLNAAGWPSVAQRVYFTTIAFFYLSFWIPQIHRNVRRNCRRAFEWEYVLGQAALRLTPFVYFYAYPKNILFARVDYTSLSVLVIWQWLQVLLLASQALLGPRWFISGSWLPPAYDYHPILRADAEDSTLPLGFTPSSPTTQRSSNHSKPDKSDSPSLTKGKRFFDCAICMQDLEVPVVESEGAEEGSLGAAGWVLARMTYMITPCRHVFHSGCLEGWMKYRLQCPVCREGLPPL